MWTITFSAEHVHNWLLDKQKFTVFLFTVEKEDSTHRMTVT